LLKRSCRSSKRTAIFRPALRAIKKFPDRTVPVDQFSVNLGAV
jgi:hypothetical protein